MSEFMKRYSSLMRWLAVGLVVLYSMHLAMTEFGYVGFVQTWGGTLFKALSGGCVGWFISRHVCRIDLSSISEDKRPIAGLSVAFLIGIFAHALATG